MPNILGMHDPGGVSWMADSPGWVTISEALGCDPDDLSGVDYRPLSHAGLGVIVRLNHGYGPGLDAQGNPVPGSGTIPLPGQYANFARRCAHFVAASPGCTRWIIGNEPNHSQERPEGQSISALAYVDCYALCRQAIRSVPGHEADEVLVAAMAPWNVESGDWLLYFSDVLAELNETGCDGIALHTYTHAADPALITSTATMDPPYDDRYFHFLAYQDFLMCVPPALRHLPVYITETDQDVPWTDVNDGWIQAAAMEIDAWNRTDGTQKIRSLCLYRWLGDEWALAGKNQRLQDFAAALALGISSPTLTEPGEPSTPPTEPPVSGQPSPVLVWDPRLDARGARLVRAEAQPGAKVFRVVEGRWFDEAQSQGRHHTFIDVLDENGQRAIGALLQWGWQGTTTQKRAENKSDPWLTAQGIDGCAADFPMEHTAPTYWADTEGNDRVEGLGLGDLERPGMTIHTSYYFRWQLVTEPEAGTEPIPPPDRQEIYHPLPLSSISQHWGQNAENYAQYGCFGHNGTDFAAPQGMPIGAIADGVVAWAAWDEGYGYYARLYHEQLGICSVYAHCDVLAVSEGDSVLGGEIVGYVGSTGNSTGAHLHLEIRCMNPDGSYSEMTPMPSGRVDPETWCALHGVKL